MCGITAFRGPSAATHARVALARLEYRGYDSAGIAARRPDGTAMHVRTLDGVAALLPTPSSRTRMPPPRRSATPGGPPTAA